MCLGLRRSCRHNFFLRICSMRLCTPDVCLTKHESAPVIILQNNSNPLIRVHTGSTQSSSTWAVGGKSNVRGKMFEAWSVGYVPCTCLPPPDANQQTQMGRQRHTLMRGAPVASMPVRGQTKPLGEGYVVNFSVHAPKRKIRSAQTFICGDHADEIQMWCCRSTPGVWHVVEVSRY